MKRAPTDKLYSLTDFDVREVHLVDLAANKKRFLVAKRRDPVADTDTDTENEQREADAPTDATDTTPADAEQTPSSPDTSAQIMEALGTLQAAVSALKPNPSESGKGTPETPTAETTEVIKGLTQRLVRLEKQFALPNSEGPEPAPAGRDAHVWPFDINRPLSDDDLADRNARRGA